MLLRVYAFKYALEKYSMLTLFTFHLECQSNKFYYRKVIMVMILYEPVGLRSTFFLWLSVFPYKCFFKSLLFPLIFSSYSKKKKCILIFCSSLTFLVLKWKVKSDFKVFCNYFTYLNKLFTTYFEKFVTTPLLQIVTKKLQANKDLMNLGIFIKY